MIRRLTVWIAALTIAMLTMAVVLASAAHAQAPRGAGCSGPGGGPWHMAQDDGREGRPILGWARRSLAAAPADG
ncbi:MAG: hypothetical protein ACHP9T_12045 [Caulobacterales bacterium]|jgi:hypothetical protein